MTMAHKKENTLLINKMLAKFRKPQSQFAALMPISALSLSACGGGGGGGGGTTPIETSTVVNGSVLKGQITNALVFSDLNSNGIFDTAEPSAFTDENGNFNLTTSDASAKLIALGQVGSIDKSTGASAENIDFSGTSSGTVISPFSTVITEGGMTSEELADSLGLGDVDLLNFNPFAAGVDATTALLVEKTSHQLENVINSFTEVTKGSGLTAAQAKATALDSFAAAAKEKLALKETIDLSTDADVTAISANIAKSMTLTVAEAEALTTKLNTASTALKNVNTEIKTVVDLTSNATKGAFSLGQLLKDQITENISNGADIDLIDSAKVALASANLAPSELIITSSSITENATDLAVGTFSATDEDASSLVYGLAGTDAGKFNLSETGQLSLKAVANFEAQSSYDVVLNVEDAGGKKSASKFQIDVENVNDAASGSVSITGTAKEGAVLTADISKIIDEDSSDIASIAEYQWLRDGVEISGATSKEFTLSQSDVASALSLNVSYKDGSDTTETFSSSATAQVENVNDAPSGILKISGTPAQEDILTADTSGLSDTDGLGTFSYQWMRDETAISGETSTILTLGETDVGKKISVTVTYTDQQGTSETVTSASTNAISNKNDLPTGSVTLSGEAIEGQVLSLDTSTIADADGLGDFSISWLRDGETISGATSSNYTLTQQDVGASVSGKVTYVDGGGITESLATSATAIIENVNDAPTGSIIISGSNSEGSTLTLDTSSVVDEDGLGSLIIVWKAGDTAIAGANTSTYILTSSEIGKTISAQVSYTDGQGASETLTSASTLMVTNVNTEPTGSLRITGTTAQGETLTADTSSIADADGLGALSYQWMRDGIKITGETNSIYTTVDADVGAKLSAAVTYTDLQGTAETLTSASTTAIANKNDAPTGSLVLSGSNTESTTLHADASGIADADGLGDFTFTWFRDGEEIINTDTWSGGNVSVQELVMSDSEIQARKDVAGAEKVLKIYISQGGDDIVHNRTSGEELSKSLTPEAWQLAYMRDNMTKLEKYIDIDFQEVSTKAESDAMFVIHPVPNKDSVSSFGEFKGSTLMMSHSGGLASPLHLETDPTKVVHTDQSKATQIETFLHELGHLIGLEHPWDMKDGDNDQAVLTSDDPHTATLMGYGGQALNGEYPNAGNEGWFYDIDTAALISIWGAAGATKSQFEVLQEDVGKTITATVTYTDKGGVIETVTSNTIAAIQNVNYDPFGSINISGDAKKGSTLTLDTTSVKDEDGLGTFSIEWLRDDFQTIVGEAASTYTLTSSDVGKTILAKIEYTDGQGTSEILYSSATTTVENVIAKGYTSGNIILDSTNGTWFDRSIEVYGIELVIAGEVAGQEKVPDEWAKKTAETIKLLINPDAVSVDATSQANMIATLAGDAGTWHAGLATGQRIGYGGGDDYNPNPLTDSGVASYEGYETWLDSGVQNDMVWYQNSSNGAVSTAGDNDIQELLEHLMHTIHLYGVRGGVTGSEAALNADVEQAGWDSTELYFALKEAVDNGAFDISGYGDADYTNPNTYAVASKEYTYVLNFGMWEFGSEFWPDKDANGLGSLAPEWADNVRTPAGVQENNPLGYELFNKYFAPVLSKPDVATLRSMFQDNDGGLSGYVADVFSESIGAISVINSGTKSAPVLDFYLDETKDPDDDGVSSLDVILTFDPTDASFTSFSYANGFLGAANDAFAEDGTITFAAIALPGISADSPLFTMTMSDLDSSADFFLTVSDLNVDGSILDGSTLIV